MLGGTGGQEDEAVNISSVIVSSDPVPSEIPAAAKETTEPVVENAGGVSQPDAVATEQPVEISPDSAPELTAEAHTVLTEEITNIVETFSGVEDTNEEKVTTIAVSDIQLTVTVAAGDKPAPIAAASLEGQPAGTIVPDQNGKGEVAYGPGGSLVGETFWKKFEDDKYYNGAVIQFAEDEKWYRVKYTEDGEEEDLEWEELKPLLAQGPEKPAEALLETDVIVNAAEEESPYGPGKKAVGKPYWKLFEDGEYYKGMVVDFDEEERWYRVKYEIDGDEEDLEWGELKPLIAQGSMKPKHQERKRARPASGSGLKSQKKGKRAEDLTGEVIDDDTPLLPTSKGSKSVFVPLPSTSAQPPMSGSSQLRAKMPVKTLTKRAVDPRLNLKTSFIGSKKQKQPSTAAVAKKSQPASKATKKKSAATLRDTYASGALKPFKQPVPVKTPVTLVRSASAGKAGKAGANESKPAAKKFKPYTSVKPPLTSPTAKPKLTPMPFEKSAQKSAQKPGTAELHIQKALPPGRPSRKNAMKGKEKKKLSVKAVPMERSGGASKNPVPSAKKSAVLAQEKSAKKQRLELAKLGVKSPETVDTDMLRTRRSAIKMPSSPPAFESNKPASTSKFQPATLYTKNLEPNVASPQRSTRANPAPAVERALFSPKPKGSGGKHVGAAKGAGSQIVSESTGKTVGKGATKRKQPVEILKVEMEEEEEVFEEFDEVEEEEEEEEEELFHEAQGRLMQKKFGETWYMGRVREFNPVTGYYKVVYADNDKEDFEWKELVGILLPPLAKVPPGLAHIGGTPSSTLPKKPNRIVSATKPAAATKQKANVGAEGPAKAVPPRGATGKTGSSRNRASALTTGYLGKTSAGRSHL